MINKKRLLEAMRHWMYRDIHSKMWADKIESGEFDITVSKTEPVKSCDMLLSRKRNQHKKENE